MATTEAVLLGNFLYDFSNEEDGEEERMMPSWKVPQRERWKMKVES